MPTLRKNSVYAGRYRLEELIGEGGFSEVWRACDLMADDAVVALKIYAPGKGLDEYGIRQFRKEYSIAFDLSHPNLMKVLHFDICNGSPYLIMPYFPLGSVSHYLQDNPVLSEKQIACFMYQIGGALEELHSQQPAILHQDIKPDNILVRNKEHFVLTDFGISNKTRHTLTKATGSANSLTIAYSPPERFDRTPVSTEASDIFSLGVSLYEMCSGIVPWDGHGGQTLLIGGRVPDLPAKFSRVLNKILHACMALAPAQRPSAEQLKNLGKYFLENGSWKFVVAKKGFAFSKVAIVMLIVLSVTLISVGLIYVKPQIKETSQSKVGDATHSEEVLKEKLPDKKIAIKPPENRDSISSVAAPKDSVASGSDKIAGSAQGTTSSSSEKADSIVAHAPAKPKRLNADSVQYYLNTLSNQSIPRQERSELKKEVLELFAGTKSKILQKNENNFIRHAPAVYLNLLMDSTHNIRVLDAAYNRKRKIETLWIEVSTKQQL